MMKHKLTLEQIRLLRLHAQRLHPETSVTVSTPGQLVIEICGLQAQELPSATLGVRARSTSLVAQDVRYAREEQRSVVLTWCMRGTRHLVSAQDLGWMLPLFGPLFIHKSQRRYNQLGLTREVRIQAAGLMQEVLSRRGPLTRSELAVALAPKGVPVEGQAIAYLVNYAALEGIICFGPQRDSELTYVLLEDWIKLGQQLDQEQAQAELARRYLEAYGPAAPQDLASWAGISIGQARAGFEAVSNDLLEIEKPQIWMLQQHAAWLDEPSGDPTVRLLPRFDAYLLGYQDREFMLSAQFAKRVHPGGGIIKSAIIVDGLVVGIWRGERKSSGTTIVVEPFKALDAGIKLALEAEVQDIARFLGEDAHLRVQNP